MTQLGVKRLASDTAIRADAPPRLAFFECQVSNL
jgi:hypothetical protein